jgi:Pyruvate/2-oxoacid:ferredoxin oxidoreductase gamma subunit
MIMLGAFIRKSGLVKMETLLDHMEGIFGEGRKKIVPFNRKAAQAGFDHMAANAKP